jgi:uncharacterized membrane protein YdfJ with MMPL/SSD domain
VGTWTYNFAFMAEHGGHFDPLLWVRGGFASTASSSIAMDFYVSFAAGLVFMLAEARRLGMKRVWIYVLLLGVAWAMAFPLFLLARERHLSRAGGP